MKAGDSWGGAGIQRPPRWPGLRLFPEHHLPLRTFTRGRGGWPEGSLAPASRGEGCKMPADRPRVPAGPAGPAEAEAGVKVGASEGLGQGLMLTLELRLPGELGAERTDPLLNPLHLQHRSRGRPALHLAQECVYPVTREKGGAWRGEKDAMGSWRTRHRRRGPWPRARPRQEHRSLTPLQPATR